MSQIKLLVGLGNPESQYGLTRHNAGFWLLNLLAEQHNLVWKADQKFKAEITTLYSSHSGIEKFWLMKPSLYMNESGTSVSSFCFFYKIKAEEVLIVHDELDLKPGMLRMKKGDVMRINVDELVDFYVDDQKYFTAEMGEIKGNACVKLAKRLN